MSTTSSGVLSMSREHIPINSDGEGNNKSVETIVVDSDTESMNQVAIAQGDQTGGAGEETTLEVLQWVCEICEKATFNTFKEACEHELNCVQRHISRKNGGKDENNKEIVNHETIPSHEMASDRTTGLVLGSTSESSCTLAMNNEGLASGGGNLSMQWICEWCNNAMFQTYAEAAEHEKMCRENTTYGEVKNKSMAINPPQKESTYSNLHHSSSNAAQGSNKYLMTNPEVQYTLPKSNQSNQVAEKDENEPSDKEANEDITEWVCEFCRVEVFDSYEEAVKHEAICKMAPQNQESQLLKTEEEPETKKRRELNENEKPINHKKNYRIKDSEDSTSTTTKTKEKIKTKGKRGRKPKKDKVKESESKILRGDNAEKDEKDDNAEIIKVDNGNQSKSVRWICEICNEAAFDTYIDACCHEMQCKANRNKNKRKLSYLPTPDSVISNSQTKTNTDENKNDREEESNSCMLQEGKGQSKSTEINSNSIIVKKKRKYRKKNSRIDIKHDNEKKDYGRQYSKRKSNVSDSEDIPQKHSPLHTKHDVNEWNETNHHLQDAATYANHMSQNINHLKQFPQYANQFANGHGNIMNHVIPVRIGNTVKHVLAVPGHTNQFVGAINNMGHTPNFAKLLSNNNNLMSRVLQVPKQGMGNMVAQGMSMAKFGQNTDALSHVTMLNGSEEANNHLQNVLKRAGHLPGMENGVNGAGLSDSNSNSKMITKEAQLVLNHFGLLESEKNARNAVNAAANMNIMANNGALMNNHQFLAGNNNGNRGMRANHLIHGGYPPGINEKNGANISMLLHNHLSRLEAESKMMNQSQLNSMMSNDGMVAVAPANHPSGNGNNVARIALPPMDKSRILNSDKKNSKVGKSVDTPKEVNGKNDDEILLSSSDKNNAGKTDASYRWICECCESSVFQTYMEAAAHEAICREAKAKEGRERAKERGKL